MINTLQQHTPPHTTQLPICRPSNSWIRVQIITSKIIHGNAATCAAIHCHVSVGTLINSASTGTPEYYAY